MEGIYKAAINLLERGGVEELTAIKVAKEAGISVTSVYQYFPNKNAIIYAMYQQWLKEVIENLDKTEKKYYKNIPVFEFLKQINNELDSGSSFSEKVEIELFRAMEIYPHLQQMDREHGQEIADRLAGYMKGYGSKWPVSRLKNLGWFLYLTYGAIARGRVDQSGEVRKQFNEWEDITFNALLIECMK